MAVPKNRPSKARTRRRKSINMKFTYKELIECKNCGNKIVPHRVCKHCGFYKETQVFDPEKIK